MDLVAGFSTAGTVLVVVAGVLAFFLPSSQSKGYNLFHSFTFITKPPI